MKRWIFAGAVLFLAGCASTPQGMRDDPEAKRVFVVAANYQLVLKRLVDNSAECASGPLIPIGQVINDVQHYPDLRIASIVRGSSGIGTQIRQVFDIKETAPNQTEVTFYTKLRADFLAAQYRRIAEGDGQCIS